MNWIKRVVRNGLRRAFNRVLVPCIPSHYFPARLVRCLEYHRIDCVLDVGASTGQYAATLLAEGYRGRIISFEPTTSAYQELARRAEHHPRWQLAPRCALGAEIGELELHVARNQVSTSALEMTETHVSAAPDSAPYAVERVDLRRLDQIAPPLLQTAERLFLKIDVQGYEPEVLNGAEHILPQIRGLQVELSLVELYRGQTLFPEMLRRILSLGFDFWGVDTVFVDEQSGRTLQVDGLFFRRDE